MGVAAAPSPLNAVSPLTSRIVDVSRLDMGDTRRTEENYEHEDVRAEIEGNDDRPLFGSDLMGEHHKGET